MRPYGKNDFELSLSNRLQIGIFNIAAMPNVIIYRFKEITAFGDRNLGLTPDTHCVSQITMVSRPVPEGQAERGSFLSFWTCAPSSPMPLQEVRGALSPVSSGASSLPRHMS